MKKVISILVCVAIIVSMYAPVYAREYTAELSVGTSLQGGEGSVPMATGGGIVPMGDEDECGHYPPAGYRFAGTRHGNTEVDSIVQTAVGVVLSFVAPSGVDTVIDIALEVLDVRAETTYPRHIQGDYLVMTYECLDPGIYPYIYWHHISCNVDYDGDGIAEYICTTEMEYALLPK